MKKMNSSGQQKKRTTTSMEKKLNELPDSVILHILSLIDTQKTVQTCLLSYRWTRLWTHLPNLSFDSTSFRDRTSFKKFVLGVLSRRKACNIQSLKFWSDSKDKHFISKVFDYAGQHVVQEVNINSEDCFVPCFLSYQSLTTLKIESCSIHHHNFSERPIFASLTTLYLKEVFLYLESDSLHLFSNCVNLEELSLINCRFYNSNVSLKISSPRLVNLTMKDVSPDGEVIISTPRLPELIYENSEIFYSPYRNRGFDCITKLSVDGCSLDRVNIQIGTCRAFKFIKDHFGSNLNIWYQKVIKKIFPKTQSLTFQFGGCKMMFVKCNNHLSIEVHGTGIDEGMISLSWKLDRSDDAMNNLGVEFFGTVSFVICPIIFMTLNLSRMELKSSLQGLLHERRRDVNLNKMKKTIMLSELPAFQVGFQMAWDNVLAPTNKPLDIQKLQKHGISDAPYQPVDQNKSFLSRNGRCIVTRTLRGKIIWQMQWPN